MRITIKQLKKIILSEAVLLERESDIQFRKEANTIFDEVLAKVSKRAFAVLKPNIDNDSLSSWNGVHVSANELGITTLPEVLSDLVFVFAWGIPEEPISSAWYLPPDEEFPSGVIGIGYNVNPPRGASGNKSKPVKLMKKTLNSQFANTELEADLDIIPYVGKLLQAKKVPFIHELKHAYDMLVRDDEGKMAQHMHKLSDRLEAGEEDLNFTGDDEMNAYIVMTIEDTIEDFKRHSRNKPTQLKAKKWAPNATILWNKFLDNMSTAVKELVDEKTLLKRAAGRLNTVWDDYVEGLPE